MKTFASLGIALIVMGLSAVFAFRRPATDRFRLVPASVPGEELIAVSRSLRAGNGEWTLVEFMDYECPPCRTAHARLDVADAFPSGMSWRVAAFPLDIHPKALELAYQAESFSRTRRFREVHQSLVEGGQILNTAVRPEDRQNVERAMRIGIRAKVQGTPSFFLVHNSGKAFKIEGFGMPEDLVVSGTTLLER